MLHRVLRILRVVLVLLVGQGDHRARVHLVSHLRLGVYRLELVASDGLLVQRAGFDRDLRRVVKYPCCAGIVLREPRGRLTFHHVLHRVLRILRVVLVLLIGIDINTVIITIVEHFRCRISPASYLISSCRFITHCRVRIFR